MTKYYDERNPAFFTAAQLARAERHKKHRKRLHNVGYGVAFFGAAFVFPVTIAVLGVLSAK